MKQNIKKSPKTDNLSKKTTKKEKINVLEFLTEYMNLYIDSKHASNLSEKTIYNAKLIFERFYDYVADELSENEFLSLNDINKYFLNDYLNKLTKAKLNKTTQKLHLTVIKGFFWFVAEFDIQKYGFLKNNINGLRIKTEQKEKDSFGQNEQERLLKYVATLDSKNTYLAQRNALLIKILLYTGIRISELINIKSVDITEHEHENHGLIYVILVKGKGNKERYTYLSYNEASKNIDERINEIEVAMQAPDFWSNKNQAQEMIRELQNLKDSLITILHNQVLNFD